MPDNNNNKDLDNLENYYQNAIAGAANLGAFSLAPGVLNDLTLLNPISMEAEDNLTEKKERIEDITAIKYANRR